jgi:hypothetical protein
MVQEGKGILISIGIIAIADLIKSDNEDIGNYIQGFGLGIGGGTLCHIMDKKYPTPTPHHDLVALISLPTVFILDKTDTITNKTLINNLYGASLGFLVQHQLTEGCSWCNTYYCKSGEQLC